MPHPMSKRFAALERQLKGEEAQLDDSLAQVQAQKRAVIEKLLRVERGLPAPNACPDCWIEDGKTSYFEATAADDPSEFDRWICRSCGLYFDRPAQ